MKRNLVLILLGASLSGSFLYGQGTVEDYSRAFSLPEKYKNTVFYSDVNPRWIGDTHTFWYIRHTPEGDRYVIVDAEKRERVAMPDTMKQRIL